MKTGSGKDMEVLLEKFMDGKTTLEEERLLARYFRRDDVPDCWADYKEMLRLLGCGTAYGAEKEETRRRKPAMIWWIAAASVALLAVITFTMLKTTPQGATETVAVQAKTEQKSSEKGGATNISQPTEGMAAVTETAEAKTATPATRQRQQAGSNIADGITAEESIKRLMEENRRLNDELQKMEEDMLEMKRRLVVSQMETMGYSAAYMEDGSIEFTDNNNQIITEL
ncbi:MAG: hypothetical protein SOZ80_05240 [Prevotella sp.]|uniref:hypothetical protein n=1 Tax=Prevotella sp. TaxID=59823 RepID=UPI002A3437F1|nr:hypothetical protein [Prevotella sp.]MDD7318484.1 hypothetical protein [Prevotellaceae bacterium]MDY4020165.1 hypothetical protein [Prevotella sp.]